MNPLLIYDTIGLLTNKQIGSNKKHEVKVLGRGYL